MKCVLVINTLSCGGAEKVLSILANAWVERGYEITIIKFDDCTMNPFFYLDPEIKIYSLNLFMPSKNIWVGFCNNLKRIKKINKKLKDFNPEIVISFSESSNILTRLASINLNNFTVLTIHTSFNKVTRSNIWALLQKISYLLADRIIVLTERVKYLQPSICRKRTVVIPNPILPIKKGKIPQTKELPRPLLIAVGRLHPVKRYDLLLKAFGRLQSRFPDWHLAILGEGEEREALEKLRMTLSHPEKVMFTGNVSSPQDYLQNADGFVLSSRQEGFPMALCEAMACGLPVVATDCPTGPKEIIKDGINGLLIEPESIDALEHGMARLMGDHQLRARLSQKAPEVVERYGLEKVLAAWDDLFHEAREFAKKK